MIKMENVSSKEKFDAAVNVIKRLPKNGPFQPSNELLLKFYAYYKQATIGKCNIPKPWSWDVVNKAKWEAWNSIHDMSQETAQESYVSELKKIVETMPQTEEVTDFMNKLGFYYELVEENDENDKDLNPNHTNEVSVNITESSFNVSQDIENKMSNTNFGDKNLGQMLMSNGVLNSDDNADNAVRTNIFKHGSIEEKVFNKFVDREINEGHDSSLVNGSVDDYEPSDSDTLHINNSELKQINDMEQQNISNISKTKSDFVLSQNGQPLNLIPESETNVNSDNVLFGNGEVNCKAVSERNVTDVSLDTNLAKDEESTSSVTVSVSDGEEFCDTSDDLTQIFDGSAMPDANESLTNKILTTAVIHNSTPHNHSDLSYDLNLESHESRFNENINNLDELSTHLNNKYTENGDFTEQSHKYLGYTNFGFISESDSRINSDFNPNLGSHFTQPILLDNNNLPIQSTNYNPMLSHSRYEPSTAGKDYTKIQGRVNRGGEDKDNKDGDRKPEPPTRDKATTAGSSMGASPSSRRQAPLQQGASGGRDDHTEPPPHSQSETQQITLALTRLQHDMSSVITRLDLLERLTRQRPQANENHQSLTLYQWIPVWLRRFVPNVSRRTLFFMFLWPIFVHWLMIYIFRRRRRPQT